MEILRVYADKYVKATNILTMALCGKASLLEGGAAGILQGQLEELIQYCDDLPMTTIKIRQVLQWLENAELANQIGIKPHSFIQEILSRLQDELALKLFLQVRPDRQSFYDDPTDGWESILDAFPETQTDAEEMYRCFALSRYAASIFHALQLAEWGAIALGEKIGANDPKRGWVATERQLKRITDAGHAAYSGIVPYDALEQIHQEIQVLSRAWRNKIDHAANRLMLLPSVDFHPDAAEHIIQSVKVFMLRLREALI